MKTEIASILAGALLFTSCAAHKPVAVPEFDFPPSYSVETGTADQHHEKWWEAFGDSELNRTIEDALLHNPDIQASYERFQQFLAQEGITRSAGGLNVMLEATAGRSRQPGLSGTNESDTFSLSAAASYEIDLWGKLESRTRAAEFDALASREDLYALYISVSAQLADLYYLAVEQRAQLELSDRAIESFQDTVRRVERRYREGLVSVLDVYQARENLASAKAQEPLFESRLAVTLNAMSVLLGRMPGRLTGGDQRQLIEAPEYPAGIPSELLNRRPDIRAAYLRLQSSDARLAAAVADRFPSFNLIGSYGGTSGKVRTILDSPNIFWNILLQAAQPVLDAGRRKAEVDRTSAVFRESLTVYHKTVLNAFREVEDAIARGSATKHRIKMLGEVVSASDGALRVATDQYMQGLTDYLPVLTEQLRHFTAKSNLLTAKRQLISDRIQLARALGGKWVEDVPHAGTELKTGGTEIITSYREYDGDEIKP